VPPEGPDGWPAAGWKLSDVWIGMALWIAAIIVTSVALIAVVGQDGASDPSPTVIAVSVVPNALVFIGWPLHVARRVGARDGVRASDGVDARDGVGSPGESDAIAQVSTGATDGPAHLRKTPRGDTSTRGTRRAALGALGLGFAGMDVLYAIGATMACFVGAGLISVLLTNAVPGAEAESNIPFDPDVGFSTPEILLLFFVIAVLTPVAEETFFRGLAIPAFRRRMGPVWAVLASAALFTIPHLAGSVSGSGIAVLAGVIGWWGIVLGALRFFTNGRIGASILTHALLNGTSLFVSLDPFEIIDNTEALSGLVMF